MISIVPRTQRLPAVILRLLALTAGVASAAPLVSVFATDPPFFFSALVLIAASLGLLAPRQGVMTVAALFPLSTVIGVLGHFPMAGSVTSESLVLAFLAGWFVRIGFAGHSGMPLRLRLPLLCLVTLVIGSALVAVAGTIPDGTSLARGEYQEIQRVLEDFPQRRTHLHPWFTAIRWLAALGFFSACAAVVSRASDRYQAARQILKMLVLGLTAAAILNIVHFVETVVASPNPYALGEYLSWLRVNIHYPDLNAAGSVLVMCALVLVAFTRTSGRLAWLPVLALTVTLAALWLAGSRTAIATLVLTSVGGALLEWGIGWSRRGVIVASVVTLAAIAGAGVMIWQFPRERANVDPGQALSIRAELFSRSARMVREHPVFGVGVGRYFSESVRYATPGAGFGHENAHNDLAQIASEFGLIGFAAFLWLLYEALAALARDGRAVVPLRFRAWWLTGISAYLLTGAAGHPLIVFDAAVPFWIVLGAAAGLASAPVPAVRHAIAGTLAAVVLVTLPIRLAHERSELLDESPMLTWEAEGDMRFRDVGAADTLVLRRSVAALMLPLRLRHTGATKAQARVEIALDGEVVHRVVVTSDEWTTVRLGVSGHTAPRTVTLTLAEPSEGMRLLVGRVASQ